MHARVGCTQKKIVKLKKKPKKLIECNAARIKFKPLPSIKI